MQLMQLPTLFFGRLAVGTDPHRSGLAQRSRVFALGDALFGFGMFRAGSAVFRFRHSGRLFSGSGILVGSLEGA